MVGLVQGSNSDGEVYEYWVRKDFMVETAITFPDDGMTRQEFADECNINILLANYEQNGILPPLRPGEQQYFDTTGIPDLAQAYDAIHAAEEAFMRLPASVRKELDNDPRRFVDYAEDPANLETMRKWGLAPPAEPVQAPAEPAPPPEAK